MHERRKSISPRLLEKTVGSVFKRLGYHVYVTAYQKDGGIDVILSRGDKRIGVQVKATGNRVSVEQIRSLVGALVRHGMTSGIFVTTSDFTRDARKLAEEYGSDGYCIQLFDAERFLEALRVTRRPMYQSAEEFLDCVQIDPSDIVTVHHEHRETHYTNILV